MTHDEIIAKIDAILAQLDAGTMDAAEAKAAIAGLEWELQHARRLAQTPTAMVLGA